MNKASLYFEKIRWKNLLSTGSTWTEISLNKSPNTLIVGENGAGKSTSLDALCYVLYGKPFRKIKKDQLINSINGRELRVEVEFTSMNKKYRVIRGMKPNIFEIYCNDTLLNQDAANKDYQNILEKTILRMNFKSFTQIIILGSSSFVPFMQLPTGVRREVIEDLLDLRIFSVMSVLLKDEVQQNKEDMLSTGKDYDAIEELIRSHNDSEKETETRKTKTIEEWNGKIAILTTNIAARTDEIQEVDAAIADLRKNLADEAVVRKRIGEITNIASTLANKHAMVARSLVFFEENNVCPTCSQDITDELKNSKIHSCSEKSDELANARKILNDKYDTASADLMKIHDGQTQISRLQKKITSLSSENSADQREIETLQTQIKNFSTMVTRTSKKKAQELEKRKKGILEHKERLVNSRLTLETASNVLRDSGIKARVIKQYIPIINQLVNKYLAAMDFFVKFELNETFEEKILSRHRDDFTYDSFSEGEKMRIDLSLLFTWRTIARAKNSASTNLLILDEVFDASLDTNGCEEFLKLIHEMEHTNVFVISHKPDILQDKFRSSIKFEKHLNYSRMATTPA